MPNLLWVYLELIFVGTAAFICAYLFTRRRSTFHRVAPPRPGTTFRISIGSALLRTRLTHASAAEWSFDPPLSSVPFELTEGLQVIGEYPSLTGVLRFRSIITSIDPAGQFTVKTPTTTQIVERRSEPRDLDAGRVLIEQLPAVCIDLSPLGGRFETEYGARRGERIRLDFSQLGEPIYGWVLETYPKQLRVRFEERIPYLK